MGIGGVHFGHSAEDLAVGWVGDFEGRAGGGVDPLAVDVALGLEEGGIVELGCGFGVGSCDYYSEMARGLYASA